MYSRGVVYKFWSSRSLTARIVALTALLLTLGLSLSATVMIGLLQRHLVAQVDDELSSTVLSLSSKVIETPQELAKEPSLPTLYYLNIHRDSEEDVTLLSASTRDHAGKPLVPELLKPGESANTASGWTDPITVESTKKGSMWRAVIVPITRKGETTPSGTLTVALPLNDVQFTIQNMAGYVATTAIAIIAIGTGLATYLVRRALSPLRGIETTAGEIAAGDLTQRVPFAPASTEVGSLSKSLNSMLSQLEQSFAAREESERKIRRFVSDASHELRTPLAAISGYCELYSMGGVPSERTGEVMGRIRSESTRMSSLVEDLLTLARLDEGRPLEIVDVDVIAMLRNARFDLSALDPTRQVEIEGFDSQDLPQSVWIQADRDRLQQVLTNVIGNIVRYTPRSSPVEIAVAQRPSNVLIEFRDHGPGIAKEDFEKVFQRFYRTENSRARSLGGSGLGLSIVSSIVSAHGGHAELAKTPGGGLTVRITMPIVQSKDRINTQPDA